MGKRNHNVSKGQLEAINLKCSLQLNQVPLKGFLLNFKNSKIQIINKRKENKTKSKIKKKLKELKTKKKQKTKMYPFPTNYILSVNLEYITRLTTEREKNKELFQVQENTCLCNSKDSLNNGRMNNSKKSTQKKRIIFFLKGYTVTNATDLFEILDRRHIKQ